MKAPVDENNWFKAHEKELLEQVAQRRTRLMKETAELRGKEELEKIRAPHWMKCPKCGHDMESATLEGIEVEDCTFCKGVYFDRGEIESLLMRRTSQRFSFYRKFFGMDE